MFHVEHFAKRNLNSGTLTLLYQLLHELEALDHVSPYIMDMECNSWEYTPL